MLYIRVNRSRQKDQVRTGAHHHVELSEFSNPLFNSHLIPSNRGYWDVLLLINMLFFISRFRAMLQLGKRKPWPQALEILTNKRTMDAGPMKEYFWPLYLWLRKKRCSSKYSIGWPKNTGPNDDPCVEPTTLPDTEVGMTPPNTKATSKADAQYSRAAEKLTITVFAVLMCLNFQFNLVKSF